MKRLAVIPSDPIGEYLEKGYSPQWLKDYYNPAKFFDEVYLLSDLEEDRMDLLGMKVIHTQAKDFSKMIRDLKIDVVRAYGGNWACAVACEHKADNIPVIVSVHDSNPNKLYDSIKKADVVFCVSEVVKRLVSTKFKHKNRRWLLPNRVDFETMHPHSKEETKALADAYPYRYKILHVGRLSREKNLDTLLKALVLLGEDYCVIAVGQGDLITYKTLAQELNVATRVFFINTIPHEELGRYLSFADCMCTPSRWEGFGMVFIEALACESVVITSAIAPMNEYITHKTNGLLVNDYEDPQAIAQMISKACIDQDLRQQLKKNARESVRNFEKKIIEDQEAKFYGKILEMKDRGEFANPLWKRIGKPKDLPIDLAYQKAIDWVKAHTIAQQGIMVSDKSKVPYLEVTGYLIPTLIEANELGLARTYTEFLEYMQKPNGAFQGPDGKEYIFDSGQALRGLVAAAQQWPQFKAAALRTADFIFHSIEANGRIPFTYEDDIPEFVHIFVLPGLEQAGRLFERADYLEAVKRSTAYYKQQEHVLNDQYLTHFLAYILDGLIDLGEAEFVRAFVEKLFLSQNSNGSIRAHSKASWVCSVGLAQLAIVAYKLGMNKAADNALGYLWSIQNPTGGFYGSYGLRAKYFPKAEISWANKFFLDAVHLKHKLLRSVNIRPADQHQKLKILDQDQWYKAITAGQSVEALVAKIKANDFPVWCKPLLLHTNLKDVILELGSGTGMLAAILGFYGRQMKLLDYSKQSIGGAKQLFQRLQLTAEFYCEDMLKNISLSSSSVDWAFSSGVLEHFTDEQIIGILKESKRVSRKGVMSLVPNANALFYRIGKYTMEKAGTWAFGHEDPKWTMRPLFEAAGLHNIQEYSIGTYHTLQFWGSQQTEIKEFLDSLSPQEIQSFNQGYLLFTIGTIT